MKGPCDDGDGDDAAVVLVVVVGMIIAGAFLRLAAVVMSGVYGKRRGRVVVGVMLI